MTDFGSHTSSGRRIILSALPNKAPGRSSTGAGLGASPAAFSCECSQVRSGPAWVTPRGDLDCATAPALELALRQAQRHARAVVLDLRGVGFLGCDGIHTLLSADARARQSRAHAHRRGRTPERGGHGGRMSAPVGPSVPSASPMPGSESEPSTPMSTQIFEFPEWSCCSLASPRQCDCWGPRASRPSTWSTLARSTPPPASARRIGGCRRRVRAHGV